MICDNYRAVPMLCRTYNILVIIVRVKLEPYVEEITGEYQGGFQKGRSTVAEIFTTRQILEKCWVENIDVNNLFIDFGAAVTIWRKEMRREMHKLDSPPKLVNLCRIVNSEIYSEVKTGKYLSYEFKVKKIFEARRCNCSFAV